MSLYSALTSSVTGMAAQANKLTAVSENIANASTTGYKNANAQFEDLLSQVNTTDYTGGGVSSSIRYANTEQGDLTSTTSNTDLAIQGNGFFLVQDANGANYLTRAGSFTENSSGQLVNSAGFLLAGYSLAPGASGVTDSLSGLQPVNLNAASLKASPSTSGTLTVNLPSTAAAVTGAPSTSNYSQKTSVVAYDDLGNAVTLDVYMSKTGANTWQADVYNDASPTTPLSTNTLAFDPTTGNLTPSSPQSLSIPVPGGNTISLDISGTTQLASNFAVTAAAADGNSPSALSSISIATDGTLSYVYANGNEVAAYKVPLANVESPDSLTSLSGDVFQANSASGPILIGSANANGLGSIQSSELESSTVDLATQLTDMIQAQRGYESNSKVFQAGSDLLSELINMLK